MNLKRKGLLYFTKIPHFFDLQPNQYWRLLDVGILDTAGYVSLESDLFLALIYVLF